MDEQPAAKSFQIRPPMPAEQRACRNPLPEATGAGQESQLLVAVAGRDARVVGAAAWGPDLDTRRFLADRRWLVDLRVIAPLRRRGLGQALIECVIDQAAAQGIPALHAWEWVEPDGEAARAWSAFGFSPCQRRLDFEIDLAQAHAALRPVYERVRARGLIPDNARIIPMAEADHEAVVRLHVQYLGGTPRLLLPLIRGAADDPYDLFCSRVLLLGERVVGFTLGRVRAGGVCEFDANVIDPTLRLGWATLWLRVEAAEYNLGNDVQTLRYTGLQQHTDTHVAGQRMGARVIRTLVQMRRDLPGFTSAPASAP